MNLNWKFTVKVGIFVCIALGFIYGGYVMDRNSKLSTQWVSVPGIILANTVTKHTSSSPRGGEHTYYNPGIRYEYKTPMGMMTNSSVTYSGDGSKNYRSMAEKVSARYTVGKEVTVYFNPENPGESCLEPGRTRGGITLIIFGLLGLLACGFFLGVRALERYAGMGEFAPVQEEQSVKTSGDSGSAQNKKTNPANSWVKELLADAQGSPRIVRQVENHLFFGPIYRRTRTGDLLYFFMQIIPLARPGHFSRDEETFYLFFLIKTVLGGLAILFVFVSPFLFLGKAPDAPADFLLGVIWLPGLEFIDRLASTQKYITVCRFLLTIPVVYMGINSGNWSW